MTMDLGIKFLDKGVRIKHIDTGRYYFISEVNDIMKKMDAIEHQCQKEYALLIDDEIQLKSVFLFGEKKPLTAAQMIIRTVEKANIEQAEKETFIQTFQQKVDIENSLFMDEEFKDFSILLLEERSTLPLNLEDLYEVFKALSKKYKASELQKMAKYFNGVWKDIHAYDPSVEKIITYMQTYEKSSNFFEYRELKRENIEYSTFDTIVNTLEGIDFYEQHALSEDLNTNIKEAAIKEMLNGIVVKDHKVSEIITKEVNKVVASTYLLTDNKADRTRFHDEMGYTPSKQEERTIKHVFMNDLTKASNETAASLETEEIVIEEPEIIEPISNQPKENEENSVDAREKDESKQPTSNHTLPIKQNSLQFSKAAFMKKAKMMLNTNQPVDINTANPTENKQIDNQKENNNMEQVVEQEYLISKQNPKIAKQVFDQLLEENIIENFMSLTEADKERIEQGVIEKLDLFKMEDLKVIFKEVNISHNLGNYLQIPEGVKTNKALYQHFTNKSRSDYAHLEIPDQEALNLFAFDEVIQKLQNMLSTADVNELAGVLWESIYTNNDDSLHVFKIAATKKYAQLKAKAILHKLKNSHSATEDQEEDRVDHEPERAGDHQPVVQAVSG